MTAEIRWSGVARRELVAIASSLGRRDRQAGRDFIDRVSALIELLGEHPRAGVRRDDLLPGYRSLSIRPYLLLYRIVPEPAEVEPVRIDIVTLVDGRRDLAPLLRPDR